MWSTTSSKSTWVAGMRWCFNYLSQPAEAVRKMRISHFTLIPILLGGLARVSLSSRSLLPMTSWAVLMEKISSFPLLCSDFSLTNRKISRQLQRAQMKCGELIKERNGIMIRRVGYQGPSDLNLSTTSSSEHTQSFFVAQFSVFYQEMRRLSQLFARSFNSNIDFTNELWKHTQARRDVNEEEEWVKWRKKGYHFQIPFSFASRNVKHLISSLFFLSLFCHILSIWYSRLLVCFIFTRASRLERYSKIFQNNGIVSHPLSSHCERWERCFRFSFRDESQPEEERKGTASHTQLKPQRAHSICTSMYQFNKLCVNF